MRWVTTIVVVIVLSSPVWAQTYDKLAAMVEEPWHHVPNPVSKLQLKRDDSRRGGLDDLKAAGGGVGGTPCSEFNQSREKPEIEAMFFSWTEGYLTGWNLGLPKASQEHVDLSLMSRSEQMEFLRKWCEANPSKRYMDGATALLIRLRASAN